MSRILVAIHLEDTGMHSIVLCESQLLLELRVSALVSLALIARFSC